MHLASAPLHPDEWPLAGNLHEMDDQDYDEINTLVSLTVKQHLLLWQTTASLIEINRKLNRANLNQPDESKVQEGKKSGIVHFFQKLRSFLNM